MKYHIIFKGLALVLAACCLLSAAVCAVGIYAFSELGLYDAGFESYLETQRKQQLSYLAQDLAECYAAKTYSDVPQELLYSSYTMDIEEISHRRGLDMDSWSYAIYPEVGDRILESSPNYENTFDLSYNYTVWPQYMKTVTDTDSYHANIISLNGTEIRFRWVDGPEFRVTVRINEKAISPDVDIPLEYITFAENWRFKVIFLMVGSLALFGICAVYLCCAAGRSRKDTAPNPGGLNRLPLDIYAAAVAILCFFCTFVVVEGIGDRIITDTDHFNWGMVSLNATLILTGLLLILGWFYALAAQLKMKHFYWWHHSLIGFCIGKVWCAIVWVWRSIVRLYGLLPMVWQRVAAIGCIGFSLLLSFLLLAGNAEFLGLWLLLVTLLGSILLLVYDVYAFGIVIKGARRMAEGHLEEKIPTKHLLASYKDHAGHLNAMADVATVAAKRQMKSERMRTELITNVSHDIKTPLTSVINYVDLLQKPHSPEEQTQYLEVLERQSHRMKKLLEDLMEMSKASTGNMRVEAGQLDAVEAVNQALGEFADKLTLAQITPLFRHPENPVYIHADGKLTWRVLSNLLGNVVKYAQSGTRMYLDLWYADGQVRLSMKNISREELNISADELTERFVRGDAARNSEGSGLGLNIAQSLMELQKGSLELLVDGDLFKVTLCFPASK